MLISHLANLRANLFRGGITEETLAVSFYFYR